MMKSPQYFEKYLPYFIFALLLAFALMVIQDSQYFIDR